MLKSITVECCFASNFDNVNVIDDLKLIPCGGVVASRLVEDELGGQ